MDGWGGGENESYIGLSDARSAVSRDFGGRRILLCTTINVDYQCTNAVTQAFKTLVLNNMGEE